MAEPTDDNAKRRKRALPNDERPAQKGRKLKQYVLEEKLDIIDYAKVIGNRAAGREFNVAESSIREWRKNEQRLRAMFETAPERSRLDGGGRRPICEDLEKTLLLYIASTPESDAPLTWHAIKEKANDIWNKICEKDSEIKERDFIANMGWVARFIKKNNIQIAPNTTSTSPEPGSCTKPSISNAKYEVKNRVIQPAKPTETSQPNGDKVPSKRKRKNFTPKKMVERSCIVANNILLESLADKSFEISTGRPNDVGNLESKPADKEDEDENIDVCF